MADSFVSKQGTFSAVPKRTGLRWSILGVKEKFSPYAEVFVCDSTKFIRRHQTKKSRGFGNRVSNNMMLKKKHELFYCLGI